MTFVHGHARDTGWVMAHRRRPNDAEEGQLPLLPAQDAVVVPAPRVSTENEPAACEPAEPAPGPSGR